MQKSLFSILGLLQHQLVLTSGLIFLLVGTASAQTQGSMPTPDDVRDIVDSHLDNDGIVYGYMYIGGDIERLAIGINEALQVMRETDPDIAKIPPIADRLGQVLGLFDIQAIGISSRKNGEVFANKCFLATPNGTNGLLRLTAGDPYSLTVPAMAPGDSSFVFEQTLDLRALFDLVYSLGGEIFGAMGQALVDNALGNPIPNTDLTLDEIINSGKLKLQIIGKTYPGEVIELPGEENTVLPKFDLIIAIDGLGWLVDRFHPRIIDTDLFLESESHGLPNYQLQIPIPPALQHFSPLLAVDANHDRLYIVSNQAYLNQILEEGEKLQNTEAFQAVKEFMPEKGNSLVYIHPSFFESMGVFVDKAAQENPKAAPFLNFIKAGLFQNRAPYAQMQVNYPDGIYSVEIDRMSYKKAASALAVVPGMLAAMAIPAFNKVRQTSQEKAILSNLRQIAAASQQSMLDTGIHPVKAVDIIGSGNYIESIESVAGESYNHVEVDIETTRISVTTKDGREVSYEF